MKFCFVQSIEEIEKIRLNLSYMPIIIPLDLEVLAFCELNNIDCLNIEELLSTKFCEDGILEYFNEFNKIDFTKIRFNFLIVELRVFLRHKINILIFILSILNSLKKKFEKVKFYTTNLYSNISSDNKRFINLEEIFFELLTEFDFEILKLESNLIEKEKEKVNFSYLIPKVNNKEKKFLLSDLGYNLKRVLFYLIKNKKNIVVFNENFSFMKKLFFKIFGIELLNFQQKKLISSDIDLDIFNQKIIIKNIDVTFYLKKQIKKNRSYFVDLREKYFALNEYFTTNNVEIVISNSYRYLGGILIDAAYQQKKKSLIISHGTLARSFDSYDKIYKDLILESVHSKYATFNVIQSKITEKKFSQSYYTNNFIKSGNILFLEQKKEVKKKFVCLYAVTQKKLPDLQLFGMELYYEFYNNLTILDNFVRLNKIKLYVHLHSGAYHALIYLRKKFKNIIFKVGKIDKSIKQAYVAISFSSTVIEDALHSKRPVILLDFRNRYKHCDSEENVSLKNKSIYYVKKIEDLALCINTIKNSDKINFDENIFSNDSTRNIKELFKKIL